MLGSPLPMKFVRSNRRHTLLPVHPFKVSSMFRPMFHLLREIFLRFFSPLFLHIYFRIICVACYIYRHLNMILCYSTEWPFVCTQNRNNNEKHIGILFIVCSHSRASSLFFPPRSSTSWLLLFSAIIMLYQSNFIGIGWLRFVFKTLLWISSSQDDL